MRSQHPWETDHGHADPAPCGGTGGLGLAGHQFSDRYSAVHCLKMIWRPSFPTTCGCMRELPSPLSATALEKLHPTPCLGSTIQCCLCLQRHGWVSWPSGCETGIVGLISLICHVGVRARERYPTPLAPATCSGQGS